MSLYCKQTCYTSTLIPDAVHCAVQLPKLPKELAAVTADSFGIVRTTVKYSMAKIRAILPQVRPDTHLHALLV